MRLCCMTLPFYQRLFDEVVVDLLIVLNNVHSQVANIYH